VRSSHGCGRATCASVARTLLALFALVAPLQRPPGFAGYPAAAEVALWRHAPLSRSLWQLLYCHDMTMYVEINRLRAAELSDARAITSVVEAAYRHYVPRLGSPPRPMLDDYEQVIARSQVTVALDRSAIIGVIVLDRNARGFFIDTRWST